MGLSKLSKLLAWASTNKAKSKKLNTKRKHVLCTIFNQSKTASFEPLFLSLNVLNVLST